MYWLKWVWWLHDMTAAQLATWCLILLLGAMGALFMLRLNRKVVWGLVVGVGVCLLLALGLMLGNEMVTWA